MGNRNHLHVCQHCGIVHATSSSSGPRKCVVCDAITFSEYEPGASEPVEISRERATVARVR